MRVLIVEDDPNIAGLVQRLLERASYAVDVQSTISDALNALTSVTYNAVVLDRGLPDGDGLRVIHELKKVKRQHELPPFIVLSAIGDVSDKVDGLDAGAVDYIVKPYEPDELLARLRVCLKLKAVHQSSAIELGRVSYDAAARQITVDGESVVLARRALAIFDVLIHNVGRVVSHDELENRVYGYEEIGSNALTSQVSRLRKTLTELNTGVNIRVLRHIGYILEVA